MRLVVVLVLFPLFAHVTTYHHECDDGVVGFSTENETDPTVPTFPESVQLVINGTLPNCSADELLIFDGLFLDCAPIPERPCRCPGPNISTMEEPTVNLGPPIGCTEFEAPERGALVCLLIEEVQIYCSVVCGEDSEFSSFPLDPYTCGALTNFKWIDSVNQTTTFLPDCFQRTALPVFSREKYLPRACSELSGEEVTALGEELCMALRYTFFTFDSECKAGDVFIQCGGTL